MNILLQRKIQTNFVTIFCNLFPSSKSVEPDSVGGGASYVSEHTAHKTVRKTSMEPLIRIRGKALRTDSPKPRKN